MQTSHDTIDLAHIRSLLEEGHRVALFIRHSERPPIRPDDKDFGRTLGLTPRGIGLARAREAGSRDSPTSVSPPAR
jgi:hypothetical protein